MSTPAAAVPAPRRHPVLELLARYAAVFKAAWAARHQLAGPTRLADEAAFLPAALSLQETPVHPAPRRVALAICALFVIALVWSIVGRIDIVAVAPGRIVVSDRTKTIQPLEAAVVKRLLVKDGDVVQAGQVLVELDATNATADSASLQEQLNATQSDARRAAALVAALRSGRPPVLAPEAALPSTRAAAQDTRAAPREARAPVRAHDARDNAQVQAEWADISAKLAKLAAERARRVAEIATVRELIGKLEATLPIARQREADITALAEQGFIAGHAGQDRMRERIEQERDLATQRARLAEAQAALHESERAHSAYVAETQRTLADRQAEASVKVQQITQELSKAEQRGRLAQLTAPVSGQVQQLAIHTEGGVVTEAQPLMVIVPRETQVMAEVLLENKDIGFVRAGQRARIKLETFPFTRYGTVDATVQSVAADAVVDEKRGAGFPAQLLLAARDIDVDGKRVPIAPGLNVTAEVMTGSRRVIEYLLSPLQRVTAESMKER